MPFKKSNFHLNRIVHLRLKNYHQSVSGKKVEIVKNYFFFVVDHNITFLLIIQLDATLKVIEHDASHFSTFF